MDVEEMEDRLEQLEQNQIHMEARHAAEKAQLEDEIDTLEQAIAAERG
jgi:hypothetical protein